jgi:hypothetical protein
MFCRAAGFVERSRRMLWNEAFLVGLNVLACPLHQLDVMALFQ